MYSSYLKFCFFPLLVTVLSAKGSVDCRVATQSIDQCNPYSSKLLIAKEIEYKKDQKKLIVKKTLPVPKKKHIKVISVVDMIEKYVKIEKSIRYEGSEKRELEVLHIESVKDSNRYSIAEELELRRKRFIDELVVQEKKRYAESLDREIVCVEVNVTESTDLNRTEVAEVTPEAPEVKEVVTKTEGYYKIEKGDSLQKVAKKFNVGLAELLVLNSLEKDAAIKAGQMLTLPLSQTLIDIIATAEYKIQPGDSISMIAQEFNLSSADILKYNQLQKSSTICIGKKLILPFAYKIPELEKKRKIRLAKEKKSRKKSRMIRGFGKKKLRVTATAYSSHRGQTDSTPFLAAWNNRIRPGMKIIAVSRDLLKTYGLRNGSKVRIGGLRGYYTVRDKMNKRYKKRIDIYMGTNRRRALRWGRRSVVIYF